MNRSTLLTATALLLAFLAGTAGRSGAAVSAPGLADRAEQGVAVLPAPAAGQLVPGAPAGAPALRPGPDWRTPTHSLPPGPVPHARARLRTTALPERRRRRATERGRSAYPVTYATPPPAAPTV